MNFNTLKTKLTLVMSLGFVVIFGFLATYSVVTTRRHTIKNAEEKLVNKAELLSTKLEIVMESSFEILRTENRGFLSTGKNGDLTKSTIMKTIAKNLKSNKNFTGMSAIFEKNAYYQKDDNYSKLTEKEKFIPYLYLDANGNSSYTALVDYDKEGDGDYYLIPLKTKRELLTEPYFYPVNGKDVFMITLSEPIMENNTFMGITTIDYNVDFIQTLSEQLSQELFNGNINIAVISNLGIFVSNSSDKSFIGKNLQEKYPHTYQEQLSDIQAGKTKIWHTRSKDKYNNKNLDVAIPVKFGQTTNPWRVHFTVDEKVIFAEVNRNIFISVGTSIALLLIGLILVYFSIQRMTAPLIKLSNNIKKISSEEDKDFRMVDENAATTLSATTELDLTQKIEGKVLSKKDELGTLARSMNFMLLNLKKIISEVDDSAGQVASGAEELNSSSQIISQGSSEQAATIEELVSSIAEIATIVEANAGKAQKTEDVARKSAQMAEKGGKSVNVTVESMKKIAEKIFVIQEIAGQTKLLSLNASIEAARAGNTGKGFAVVAGEVSKLAELSSSASLDIEEITNKSVSIANEAGEQLELLVPQIQETARLIGSIATSSERQSLSIEQINISMQEVNNVVQNNAGEAEALAANAQNFAYHAKQLQNLIKRFRRE